jgi:hypothetical protein
MGTVLASRPLHLALPASALGVGGALVTADLLRVGCYEGDHRLALALAAFVPLTATALGWVFASRVVAGPPPRVSVLTGCALATWATGPVIGAVIGGVLFGAAGVPVAIASGLALGAAFGIAMAAMAAAVQRTGRARRASIVDESDRLLVAAVVLTVLGVAAGITRLWTAHAECGEDATPTPLVALACTALMFVVVALQAHRRGRVAESLARAQILPVEEHAALASRLPCVDFGVGDELGAEYAPARSAYRDATGPTRLTRGNILFARRALDQAMSLEWAMFVATLGGCAVAIR